MSDSEQYMTFVEVGQVLRAERERRELRIREVMDATKISRRNIVAMEEGDKSAMPHAVYAKGFVRSYARFLELDAEEMCRVIDREFEPDEVPDENRYDVAKGAEKAFGEGAFQAEEKKKASWPSILIMLLLLGSIIALVLYVEFADELEQPSVEQSEGGVLPSEQSTPPVLQPEMEVGSKPEETVGEDTAVNAASISESGTLDAEAPQEEAEQQTEAVTEQAEEAGQEAAAMAAPEVMPEEVVAEEAATDAPEGAANNDGNEASYEHVIVIRATTPEGCWIGVWKGDEEKLYRDYQLANGEPLRLMFNSARKIRIGFVPGVTMTYNGKPYPLDSTVGKTQDFRFGFE